MGPSDVNVVAEMHIHAPEVVVGEEGVKRLTDYATGHSVRLFE